jgi:2',3'-cyclic-nucleotide 2'-phosphodiesterase (5'-nucleotidase family)
MFRFSYLAAALFVASCTTSPVTKTYEKELTAQITVLHQSNRQGVIEPCGCTSKPWGGMDRELNAVRKIRKEKQSVVFIDSGNMLAAPGGALTLAQKQAKAKTVADMLQKLELDVFAPGPEDYALGTSFLKELAAKSKFQFLSTNVNGADGKTLFKPYVMIEKGGIKIAVVSMTPSSAVKEAGISVSDPVGTAESTLAPLRKDADLVVVLSQLGNQKDQELAKSNTLAHLIVGADENSVTESPFWYDKSLLVDSHASGFLLAQLDLDLGFPFKGFYSTSEVQAAQKRLKGMEAQLASGKGDSTLASRIARLKESGATGIPMGGSEYHYDNIKLTKQKFGKSNELTKIIAKEKERVRKEALKE